MTAVDAEKKPPLAKLIFKLRTRRNMSQPQLARTANLSKGYIGMLESGSRGQRPSREVVTAIAQAVGASAKETEELFRLAGRLDDGEKVVSGRDAFRNVVMTDMFLRQDQKAALLAAYDSYVGKSGQR